MRARRGDDGRVVPLVLIDPQRWRKFNAHTVFGAPPGCGEQGCAIGKVDPKHCAQGNIPQPADERAGSGNIANRGGVALRVMLQLNRAPNWATARPAAVACKRP